MKRGNPEFPGTAILPNWIARTNVVPPMERLVLLALVSHAGTKGQCFILRKVLAEEIGLSLSTVGRALKWLSENEYIRVIPRYTEGGNRRSSIYRINFTIYNDVAIGDEDEDDGNDFYSGMDEEEEPRVTETKPKKPRVTENLVPPVLGSDRPESRVSETLDQGHTDPVKKHSLRNTHEEGGGGSAVNPPAPEPENPSPAETPPPSRAVQYPEHIVQDGYWPTGETFDTTEAIKGRAHLPSSIIAFRSYLKQNPRQARDREWVDQRWLRWIGEDAQKAQMQYELQADAMRLQQYGAAAQPKKKKFNPNAVAE